MTRVTSLTASCNRTLPWSCPYHHYNAIQQQQQHQSLFETERPTDHSAQHRHAIDGWSRSAYFAEWFIACLSVVLSVGKTLLEVKRKRDALTCIAYGRARSGTVAGGRLRQLLTESSCRESGLINSMAAGPSGDHWSSPVNRLLPRCWAGAAFRLTSSSLVYD